MTSILFKIRFSAFIIIAFLLISSCDSNNKKIDKNNLGEIEFPNSGSESAQEEFYRGVLALHNFWYPVARESFNKARTIDPDFAMAYWGEAMSYNSTLWQNQDSAKAMEILNELGTDVNQRIEKAQTQIEKDFVKSLEILFQSAPDKLSRDLAYMSFMENMKKTYPDNSEVAAFYALSLLGVLRDNQGNESIRMKCAAESQKILDKNPKHPGALHYKIHALDDPLHAVLALDAAYEYAKVAPESNHALHMPSHIFLQLGMWDDVRKSNIAATNASKKWVEENDYSPIMLDNHSQAWLAYAFTQMGLFDSAQSQLESLQDLNKDTSNNRSLYYELDILCRNWVERPENLNDFDLDFPQISRLSSSNRARYFFIRVWSNLENGKLDSSSLYIEKIRQVCDELDSDNSYDLSLCEIYLNEAKGLFYYKTEGLNASKQYFEKAIAIEESLNPPTGPPDIVKPIHELFGEILLREQEYDEAIKYFKINMDRTPNRSAGRLGLARAYRLIDDLASAKYQYEKFEENYRFASDNANLNEALTFIQRNKSVSAMADANKTEPTKPEYDKQYKITQCLPLN